MNATKNPGGMPSAASKTASAERCAHCNGRIETLGKGRQDQPIKRCRSCGRDAEPAPSASVARELARDARPVLRPGQRCTAVVGCPGILDAGGACPCCAKRAAYVVAHRPRVDCAICTGAFTPSRKGQKCCKACKPIAQKLNVAKAPSHQAPARK